MATVIDQIAIALELDPSKLAAGIKKAAKNVDTGTKKMAGRFESLKKNVFNLRSAFTGLVGAYVVRDFITKSNAQEEAVSRLIATLKKEGIYTEALSASLQELASDIQGVTTEGDELTLSNIALMQNLGHLAEDQIPDATRAAIGLAKVMGVDSTTAFKLLGRAASGNSDMFTRYGITLDKTLSDQEKFNELLRIGADGFQLAEAEAKTGAGAIKQFGNLVGDLKEKLGDLIKEALMPVLKVLKHVVVFFNDMDAATRKAIVALVAFAAVIYKVVVPALTALHLSAGPIGWILMGIATAVAGGILVWDKYTASTRKTEQAAKSLEKTLQDLKRETVSVEAAFQQYLETKKRLGESVSVEMPKMPATAESLFGEPEIIKIHTDVDEVVLLRHELDTLAKQIEDARRLEAVGEEIPDLDAWEKLYAEKKGRLNKYIRETEDRLKAHQERLEGQEKLRADLAVKNIADQYDREREKVTQWSEKKFGIAEGNTELEAAVREQARMRYAEIDEKQRQEEFSATQAFRRLKIENTEKDSDKELALLDLSYEAKIVKAGANEALITELAAARERERAGIRDKHAEADKAREQALHDYRTATGRIALDDQISNIQTELALAEDGTLRKFQLEDELAKKKQALWEQTHAAEIAMQQQAISIMMAGYDTFWQTITDRAMTGKQRLEAMWDAMKQQFVRIVATQLKAFIFAEKMKQTESKKTTAALIADYIAQAAKAIWAAGASVVSAIASGFKWLVTTLGPFGLAAGIALGAGIVAAFAGFKSAMGFESGGYTGDGGKEEPAGIVHKGEYVVPQWIVKKHPEMVRTIETIRERGYQVGGMVREVIQPEKIVQAIETIREREFVTTLERMRTGAISTLTRTPSLRTPALAMAAGGSGSPRGDGISQTVNLAFYNTREEDMPGIKRYVRDEIVPELRRLDKKGVGV